MSGFSAEVPIGGVTLSVQIKAPEAMDGHPSPDPASPKPPSVTPPERQPVLKKLKIKKSKHLGRTAYRVCLSASWCRLLGRPLGSSIIRRTKESAEQALSDLFREGKGRLAALEPGEGRALLARGATASAAKGAVAATEEQAGGAAAAQEAVGGPMTVKAADDWLEHRKQTDACGADNARQDAYHMRMFKAGFESRLLRRIETTDLEVWLAKLDINNNSKIRTAKTVKLFYKHAIREKWVLTDPTQSWRLPSPEEEVKTLLPLDDLADLLGSLLQDKNPILPIVVNTVFAGVRRREGLRRGVADVNASRTINTVHGSQAKTHTGRQTLLHPTATAWLNEVLPWCGDKFAPFGNDEIKNEEWYQKELVAARRKAGLKTWPHNALRVLFASYHYAVHRSYQTLADHMGNKPDRAKRYVVLLGDPDEGQKLWQMTPDWIRARAARLAAEKTAAPAVAADESGVLERASKSSRKRSGMGRKPGREVTRTI